MLISVNPFKQMPYFTDREIELYQGAVRLPRGQSGLHSVQTPGGGSPDGPHPPEPLGCCRGQCSQPETQQQIHIPGEFSSEMHTKGTQTW